MTLIDWLLVGLMWCFSLTALACAVALCLSYRRPPEPVKLEVPDFVPDEWTGGDRTQTKPERQIP